MTSRIRQNYKEDCEALVNKQINMELYASYVYMSMVGLTYLLLTSRLYVDIPPGLLLRPR